MTHSIFSALTKGAAATALSAATLLFTVPAHAQPDYDRGGDYDASSSVNDVVVTPPNRSGWDSQTRQFVDRDYATRVVDVSDLDLNTDWGARELRHRVSNAARSVCRELDNRNAEDPDANAACFQQARDHALAQIPASYAFGYGE
jgi:UrcA family protein